MRVVGSIRGDVEGADDLLVEVKVIIRLDA